MCRRNSVLSIQMLLGRALCPVFFFCLEMALFYRGVVNLRPCLCGVKNYASAQGLDFLATAKNCSFPNQKKWVFEFVWM